MRKVIYLLVALMTLSGGAIADAMEKAREQMNKAIILHKKHAVGRCTQQIIYTEDVKEYVDVVEGAIKGLSPEIKSNGQSLGIVKKPLHAIFVSNENNFNLLMEELDTQERHVALTIQDYKKVKDLAKEAIKQLLLSKSTAPLRTTLGRWIPLGSGFRFRDFELIKEECYIAICPAAIERSATRIKERINESIENIKTSMLRITLIHELGHHYSLSNICNQLAWLNNQKYINDLNFGECLAQYLAYQILGSQERRIIAEKALDQSVPYRLYLLFRYYNDTPNIIKILVYEREYIKAFQVFAHLMGGQFEMGTGTIVVGKANLLFDYSYDNSKGGNVVAGEIDMLFPYRGRVIASKINTLAGRYPKDTLIVANAIDHYPDYSSLPDNIRIVRRDQYDVAKIVDKCKVRGLQGAELIGAVLKDIRISQK